MLPAENLWELEGNVVCISPEVLRTSKGPDAELYAWHVHWLNKHSRFKVFRA